MIKLVIFDCDGVLVDSEPISNRVMARHVSALGWPMDTAESMRQFHGYHMSDIIPKVSAHVGRDVGRDWLPAFKAEQEERLALEITPIQGAPELVERALAAGLKICVASQGSHDKMRVTLGTTGLLPYFERHIFSAFDAAVERPKPFPDLFLHAAKTMDVQPEECVIIEDSPKGVQAALAAEMQVIGYDPMQTGQLNIDPAVKIVSDMDAITFL